MKTFFLYTALLFSLSLSAVQLLPTKLKITVIDGLGNFTQGAIVSIYENKADYLNSKDPIQTLMTDKKGKVIFKNVKPIAYYIEAKKGDSNNNGEGALTGVLFEGRVNKVNTIIE